MSTPSILKKIVEKKKITLQREKENVDLQSMIELSSKATSRQSFKDAIAKYGLSIIGEIKKASPSKGIIRDGFTPVKIAKEYEGNVEALSVLTEEDFFLGKPNYIHKVAKVVDLPILRKDFIIDEYQIYRAKHLGASAILLIVSILDENTISKFILLAKLLNMDALVETHRIDEAKIALSAGAEIIGINNRNLHTFEVDINMTNKVAQMIDDGKLIVSESGINTKEDIIAIRDAKVDAILVGESFMRCDDIAVKAKELKDGYKS